MEENGKFLPKMEENGKFLPYILRFLRKNYGEIDFKIRADQADVLKDVRTVMFRMTGTRMSGWVLRQKETMETTMKKTEMMPIT
jgi:hypothetical protein